MMMDQALFKVEELYQLPQDSFYVTVNGKLIPDWRLLENDVRFQVHFRLRGGKGGFGSLLRSFRIHRSTNQLMCRDLSGRRLADIKEEEKLRKWIEKADEREEEKLRQRREKYERLKAGSPKHDFNNPSFIETRDRILDETDEAFEAGIAVNESKPDIELTANKSVEDILANKISLNSNVSSHKRKPTEPALDNKKRKMDKKCNVVDSTRNEMMLVNQEPEVSGISSSITGESEEKCQIVQAHCDREVCKESIIVERNAKAFSDINLEEYDSVESLNELGLDHLKYCLEVRGLKCGGVLQERAVRLFAVKGLSREKYPKALLAGSKKRKK